MVRWLEKGNGFAEAGLPLVTALLLFCLIDLVRDRISALPRYRVSPMAVDVKGLPAGMGDRAEQIRGTVPILDRPRSIVDAELPRIACDALARRPWVRRVTALKRRFPNALEIGLDIRWPVAIVCAGIERLAVDRDGIVIEQDSALKPPAFPEIRVPGAPLEAVPRIGQGFWQPAVREALAVLDDLARHARHPVFDSVRVLEVRVGQTDGRRRPGDSDIHLLLDNAADILWGRASTVPLGTLEPAAELKLDNLARLLRTYPGLIGVALVDLRLDPAEILLSKG